MTELAPGETILWSHAAGHDVSYEAPKPMRLKSHMFKIVWAIVWAVWALWLLYRTPALELGEMLKSMGPILIIGGAILWALKHWDVSQKLDRISNRAIFKGLIITNQRLLFSNGSGPKALNISASDIHDVTLDYHNGGHALQISAASRAQDILLIGIADFPKALRIIRNQLMAEVQPSGGQVQT